MENNIRPPDKVKVMCLYDDNDINDNDINDNSTYMFLFVVV